MDEKILLVIKTAFLAVGILLGINAVVASMHSNYNAGILLIYLFAIAFLSGFVFFGYLIKLPLVIKIILLIAAAVCASVVIFWYAYGCNDNVDCEEDAVIVLGAAIRGDTLSGTLRHRLDRTLQYVEQNPDAIIVVSGGKGPQENMSEAEAMEAYLISHGVAPERIIKENQSTSTIENFAFSKRLLDENLGDDYSVAFVTNDYHVFRAVLCARRAGYTDITHCHSSTSWYSVIPSGLREILGMGKFILTQFVDF